jgi:spermidine synthase
VRVRSVLVLLLLVAGLFKADWLSSLSEEDLYADDIVYSETTPYQRIVVTSGGASGFQLFLNGNLQFSSADEYRYHEALVHPAMVAVGAPRRVLILGGGDGLALREVLAHRSVEQVTLVDLDPAMTRLAAELPPLRQLNRAALDDARVTVVNQDAFVWLGDAPGAWDAVIIDFPDPNTFALSKLYTTRFYRMLRVALAPGAAVAVQATSPLFARRSFWCIVETMRAAGFVVHPYHTAVPSFGVWGFALARTAPFDPPTRAPRGLRLRHVDDEAMAGLFRFPADMAPVAVDINQLDDQMLVRYYESEWRRWED